MREESVANDDQASARRADNDYQERNQSRLKLSTNSIEAYANRIKNSDWNENKRCTSSGWKEEIQRPESSAESFSNKTGTSYGADIHCMWL